MFHLPSESILDALRFLDRFSLDGIEFACRLLYQIVSANQHSLPLRSFASASVKTIYVDGVKSFEFRLSPNDPSGRWEEIRRSGRRLSEVIEPLLQTLSNGVILGNLALIMTGTYADEDITETVKKYSRSVRVAGSLELPGHTSIADEYAIFRFLPCFQQLNSVYSHSYQVIAAVAAMNYGCEYRTGIMPADDVVTMLLTASSSSSKRVAHADELSYLVDATVFVKTLTEEHSSSSVNFESELTVARFPPPDMSPYEANKQEDDEYVFRNGTTQMVMNFADGGLRILVVPRECRYAVHLFT